MTANGGGQVVVSGDSAAIERAVDIAMALEGAGKARCCCRSPPPSTVPDAAGRRFSLFVIYGLSGYVVYAWRKAKGQPVSVISTSTEEPDERGLHN